jgi:PrtD family type I secretion system ABC transporter
MVSEVHSLFTGESRPVGSTRLPRVERDASFGEADGMPGRDGDKATTARQALRTTGRWFATVGIFSFVINMLMTIVPLYSLQVYDRILSSGHVETLVFLTGISLFVVLVLGAVDGIRLALLARIGTRFERLLAPRLLEVGVNNGGSAGPNAGQLLRELGQVRSFIGSPSVGALFDAPWAPFFVVVLWLIHPWLGMTALVSALILFALAIANDRALRAPTLAMNRRQIQAQRQADIAIRSADTVRAMGMLPAVLARWRVEQEGALRGQESSSNLSGMIGGASKFVRLGVQTLILAVGAYLVIQGDLTGGAMIAGSMLLSRALAPVEQAISVWRQFVIARQSLTTIEQALDAAPPRRPGLELPPPTGRIGVEKLSFLPPGAKVPVVKDVSFGVDAGVMVGVVGPSASGKSTLCRMLVGVLAQTAGTIRLDGADLRHWAPEALGPHIGYLPQSVDVFPGTVSDNISRLAAATPEAVIAAAKLAGVHDMVLRFPQGYDTPIGDGGLPLSGGQRQRIGLARAVFGSPRIIVLDEPNANLDADGEKALIDALAQLKKAGTTVVIVAHRPQVLRDADQILVMRDGEIALFGPRAEVLTRLTGPRLAGAAA